MDSLKLGGYNFFKGEIAEDYVTYTCSQQGAFPKIFVFPQEEWAFVTIVAWTSEKDVQKCI